MILSLFNLIYDFEMINTINFKYLGKAKEKPCQQQKDQRNMFSGVSLSESPSDAI